MFIIQECLETFAMDWRNGPVRHVPEMRYGVLEIFRVFATLVKNSWKVSATFLSFEMMFSFWIGVVLSLDLI